MYSSATTVKDKQIFMTNLKLISFPFLATDRLDLRRMMENDVHDILALRNDDKVNRFIDRPKQLNIEEAANFIDYIKLGSEEGKWIYWAISQKDSSKLIGTICLWNFSNDHTITELGYELLPQYQGQGYMNEAIAALPI